MRFVLVAAAVFLVSCSQEPPAPPPAPLAPLDAVIGAERAMAAEARQTGWVEAKESYAAPGAIVLQPGPTDAAAFFANIHPDNRGDVSLTWGPDFAGASASGDFGFTAGPFNGDGNVFGYFLTVWERQADGAWKWIYGDGVDSNTPLTVDPQGVATIAPSAQAADARAEIAAVEQALAAGAARDAAAAIADVLAGEGRVSRNNQAPARGPEAARNLLAGDTVRYAPPLRSVVRPDMAFTLGEARWEDGEGYYTRVWVLTEEGWRLAFDQLLERAPLAPAD